MLECQVIKHNLTVRDHDRLDVDDFISRIDGSINITRKQFEGMAEKLLNLIKNAITDVTNKSGYNTTQIDKVLQVGGGSRMPMIKNLLKDIFPNAEHLCEEHPDEVVAIGAAHYASYLKSETIKENRCSVM
uniref:Heat shock protein 70 n=1 Tax=Panagrolaimus superbus TaxID=310955 RepID=A0A914YWJ7_9BILA